MRNAPPARAILFVLTALLAAATAAEADTALQNGFFDAPVLDDWQIVNGTLAYDLLDADGYVESGSARGSIGPTGTSASAALRQCVDIAAGPGWFAAARVRFEPGETATGHAALRYKFFAANDCAGAGIGAGIGSSIPAVVRGVWFDLNIGDFMSGVTPDAGGVKSVQISLQLFKDGAGGALTINVDDVTLARVGVPLCRGRSATLFGTNGPDELTGTSGDDVIVGLGGGDSIYGGGGNDHLCGGDGPDRLFGNRGNDYLEGGTGADLLRGGLDADVLLAGAGNDQLFGGRGYDFLDGGPGLDICRVGGGNPDGPALCDGAF